MGELPRVMPMTLRSALRNELDGDMQFPERLARFAPGQMTAPCY
ncbi:hypothetical protein I551_1030 [Mycobacterium ulcerans str. Harvey]|uniref:Uncharacterized protein n=1 Tax=Mycobacterium ulcerans str. Harvey TaxID=1299332 RepID=A0ABP3ANJ2_MYCUL|nr:hypothetical protein I551_1030 [Mycobacterium ulcerans str. Harvey]